MRDSSFLTSLLLVACLAAVSPKPDIAASNGVIRAIDHVLLPPGK